MSYQLVTSITAIRPTKFGLEYHFGSNLLLLSRGSFAFCFGVGSCLCLTLFFFFELLHLGSLAACFRIGRLFHPWRHSPV